MTPSSSTTQGGLSLLEVLVVMAIVAAIIGALTLSLGGNDTRILQHAAERNRELLQLACERANASGTDMGIVVADGTLQFGFIEANAWKPFGSDDSSDPLRARPGIASVSLTLYRDGRRIASSAVAPNSPQLACMGSGELTPFELIVASTTSNERWRIAGAFNQQIVLERDANADR